MRPRRAAAGVKNLHKMASKKIVNLAASCFGGGFFQPLFDPTELSERDLRLINQAQFLIIHQNTSRERLSRNWADQINYDLTREDLINRLNFFNIYTHDGFTREPEPKFIFEARNIPQRDIFIEKMNYQISELLENSFFMRFLYKFTNLDNAENINEKDRKLEEINNICNPYEDIYMANLLESIRNCLSSTFFCGLCLKSFKKSEEILPHMNAYHRSYVSNEEVEALRNSRDARRRQESEDRMRTRHGEIHPDCNSCFVVPE